MWLSAAKDIPKSENVQKILYWARIYIDCFWKQKMRSLFAGQLSPQPAITCSKLTLETLGQGVKYVQS